MPGDEWPPDRILDEARAEVRTHLIVWATERLDAENGEVGTGLARAERLVMHRDDNRRGVGCQGVALLLIDVINDLEFEGAELLLEPALAAADRIAALKGRALESGMPIIYANDNFGQWRSDFRATVRHCLEDQVRGEPIARRLRPGDDDYFVLKPKPSAFYSTSLATLLTYLRVHTLILTGFAGNICVLLTAADAYLRDFHIVAPADCMASNTDEQNRHALALMGEAFKAHTSPSGELHFEEIAQAGRDHRQRQAQGAANRLVG